MYWVHFMGSAHLHWMLLVPEGSPDPNAASLQQKLGHRTQLWGHQVEDTIASECHHLRGLKYEHL